MDTRSTALSGTSEVSVTNVGADDADRARVVTIFSSTGGSGTTTVAVNLAATLARDGQRQVCVVDLDVAFRAASTALAAPSTLGLGDLPNQPDLDPSAVLDLVARHPCGLGVLVAPDQQDEGRALDPAVLTRVLAVLRAHFDVVVIDTPSTFDELVLAAFEASDLIVAVATFAVEPLKELRLTLETLGLLAAPGRSADPATGWRVVINRVEASTGLAAAEAARSLPVAISAELPLSDELEASARPGEPIALTSPEDPFSLALRSFADEQLSAADDRRAAPERSSRRTLSALRRLWRP